MDKKINRAINCYPLLYGMYADLLFYVAIDTLFLATVKGFSASEIVLLTTISLWVGIALRFPMLWLNRKLGNTLTIRGGTICMLLSALLITFGPNFALVLLGRCLRLVAQITNEIANVVALENNLVLSNRSGEFLPKRTLGTTYYSAITLVISLIAPALFQINSYLPMYLCIAAATIAVVISFFVADYSPYNHASNKPPTEQIKKKIASFAILAILAFGIAYSVILLGISDFKLFMQEDLQRHLPLKTTVSILGVTIFLSRISRLLTNMVFPKVFRKFQLKTIFIYCGVYIFSIVIMLTGGWSHQLPFKILLLGLGYIVNLFCVDPVRHYIQQVLVLFAPREDHQNLFAYLSFAGSFGSAILSIGSTLVLLNHTMTGVMVLFLAIAVVAMIMMWILYRIITKLTPINSVKTN